MLLESLSGILQNGITLAAMLAVLRLSALAVRWRWLVSTLPALYVVLRQYGAPARMADANDRRRAPHLVLRLAADELRGGFRAAVFRAWATGFERLTALCGSGCGTRNSSWRKARRSANSPPERWRCWRAARACSWIAWRAIRGWITPGDLALFYQAFQQGLGLMRSLLQNLGQLYSSSLFLGNLFEFLGLEPTVLNSPSPRPMPAALESGIHFERVTFQYPGAREPTLADFSLTIPAGRDCGPGRPQRGGQEHLRQTALPLLRPGRRPHRAGWPRSAQFSD